MGSDSDEDPVTVREKEAGKKHQDFSGSTPAGAMSLSFNSIATHSEHFRPL